MKNSFCTHRSENIDEVTQKSAYFPYQHFLYCLQGIQQTSDKAEESGETSSVNEEDEGTVCHRWKSII